MVGGEKDRAQSQYAVWKDLFLAKHEKGQSLDACSFQNVDHEKTIIGCFELYPKMQALDDSKITKACG